MKRAWGQKKKPSVRKPSTRKKHSSDDAFCIEMRRLIGISPKPEYLFHKKRNWRIDYYMEKIWYPDEGEAIEVSDDPFTGDWKQTIFEEYSSPNGKKIMEEQRIQPYFSTTHGRFFYARPIQGHRYRVKPFDSVRLAIEVEGGIWVGGRHINPIGFKNDMVKYNELAQYGIMLHRCEPNELLMADTIKKIGKIFGNSIYQL